MAERIEFRLDTTPLRQLARKYPQIAAEEMIAVMSTVINRLEGEVVSRTPSGVGGASGLRGSIAGEIVRGMLSGEVMGRVGTPLPHADPVEFGTRPHMPPLAPIILWASRKLGLQGKELRNAARGIQWKIAHHGTEGHHMFRDSFEALDGWMMNTLETIVPRITERVNSGTF